MRRAPPSPAPQCGFTLIEVIVGIALLAAFMSGVYTVAIGSMKAKRKIQEMSAVFTAGPAILDLIERDIRGAYISGVKDFKAFKAQRQIVGDEESVVGLFHSDVGFRLDLVLQRQQHLQKE